MIQHLVAVVLPASRASGGGLPRGWLSARSGYGLTTGGGPLGRCPTFIETTAQSLRSHFQRRGGHSARPVYEPHRTGINSSWAQAVPSGPVTATRPSSSNGGRVVLSHSTSKCRANPARR